MIKPTTLLILLGLLAAAAGCRKAPTEIPRISDPDWSGIAEFDINGNLIHDDPDDWLPRAQSGSSAPLQVIPTFPNPTNGAVSIGFVIPGPLNLRVDVLAAPADTVATLISGDLNPGNYRVQWDLRDPDGHPVPDGLYRVQMNGHLPPPGGSVSSHGDIEVRR